MTKLSRHARGHDDHKSSSDESALSSETPLGASFTDDTVWPPPNASTPPAKSSASTSSRDGSTDSITAQRNNSVEEPAWSTKTKNRARFIARDNEARRFQRDKSPPLPPVTGMPTKTAVGDVAAHRLPPVPPAQLYVPPMTLTKVSSTAYAFGNDQSGYFFIPAEVLLSKNSLGLSGRTGDDGPALPTVVTIDESRNRLEGLVPAAVLEAAAAAVAAASVGGMLGVEGVEGNNFTPTSASKEEPYTRYTDILPGYAPAFPVPPFGTAQTISSPFNPAVALGFSPFVPPSPGPYSPIVVTRPVGAHAPLSSPHASRVLAGGMKSLPPNVSSQFQTPPTTPTVAVTQKPQGFDPSAYKSTPPSIGLSFLNYAANAMAGSLGGPVTPVTEEVSNRSKQGIRGADASDKNKTDEASDELDGTTITEITRAKQSGTVTQSAPPTATVMDPAYTLPASLSASPQIVQAYNAEYVNTMRAWEIANPAVAAAVAHSAQTNKPYGSGYGRSLSSVPGGTPLGGSLGGSPLGPSPSSTPYPPNSYLSNNGYSYEQTVACSPLNSPKVPYSPPWNSSPTAGYSPSLPVGGYSPNRFGSVPSFLHSGQQQSTRFGAPFHPRSPRTSGQGNGFGGVPGSVLGTTNTLESNRVSRKGGLGLGNTFREHSGKDKFREPASLRGHLFAERSGLGSSTGAVLVGSGGDGLGEATRGPRIEKAAAKLAKETSQGNEFPSETKSSYEDPSETESFPSFLQQHPTECKRSIRKERQGVAADPEFRESVWRFAEKNKGNDSSDANDLSTDSKTINGLDAKNTDRIGSDMTSLDDLDIANTRFFVIKSYTEDDVHKGLKYGVWTSTDAGNQKLDAAWRCEPFPKIEEQGNEADDAFLQVTKRAEQAIAMRDGKGDVLVDEDGGDGGDDATVHVDNDTTEALPVESLPNEPLDTSAEDTSVRPRILLLFSVNSSGHFCGVAEMTSPVDFETREDFWQRDKWPGCFKVKWHFVKDVPNNSLRHIRLVESDKKPVTNARDTQEVEPGQGRLVLNVFKQHKANTSLLDDFDFYAKREQVRKDVRFNRLAKKRNGFASSNGGNYDGIPITNYVSSNYVRDDYGAHNNVGAHGNYGAHSATISASSYFGSHQQPGHVQYPYPPVTFRGVPVGTGSAYVAVPGRHGTNAVVTHSTPAPTQSASKPVPHAMSASAPSFAPSQVLYKLSILSTQNTGNTGNADNADNTSVVSLGKESAGSTLGVSHAEAATA